MRSMRRWRTRCAGARAALRAHALALACLRCAAPAVVLTAALLLPRAARLPVPSLAAALRRSFAAS
jgi:hypothetical protein